MRLRNVKGAREAMIESEYTVNGYIQESILYSLLLKLIDKGDFDE